MRARVRVRRHPVLVAADRSNGGRFYSTRLDRALRTSDRNRIDEDRLIVAGYAPMDSFQDRGKIVADNDTNKRRRLLEHGAAHINALGRATELAHAERSIVAKGRREVYAAL